jgi:hypothetical protein
MTVTISRLYNSYDDARAAVRDLEAAGIAHSDISIIASNADIGAVVPPAVGPAPASRDASSLVTFSISVVQGPAEAAPDKATTAHAPSSNVPVFMRGFRISNGHAKSRGSWGLMPSKMSTLLRATDCRFVRFVGAKSRNTC